MVGVMKLQLKPFPWGDVSISRLTGPPNAKICQHRLEFKEVDSRSCFGKIGFRTIGGSRGEPKQYNLQETLKGCPSY
jgi:hypothetical protein